ncbi:MAG: hypothetical protein AAGP08_09690, partial [Pseudomonadota bacterium]
LGADEIYGRRDLFVWEFTRKDANAAWTMVARPVALDVNADPAKVSLVSRGEPTIRLNATLSARPDDLFVSTDDVDAVIELNIKTGTAGLNARLFGQSMTLMGKAEPDTDRGLILTFDLADESDANALVTLNATKLSITMPQTGAARLGVAGDLVIRGLQGNGTALSLSDSGLTWMAVKLAPEAHDVRLRIDHENGAMWLATAGDTAVNAGEKPLFHFVFGADGGRLVLGFAATFGDQGKALDATAAFALIQGYDATSTANQIRHDLFLAPGRQPTNTVAISWDEADAECPIRWPTGGLSLRDPGDDLQTVLTPPAIPAEYDPGPVKEKDPAGRQSRVLQIDAGAPVATHRTRLRWREHTLNLTDMLRVGDLVRPAEPIRMLMAVHHELTAIDRTPFKWESLDHVTLTWPSKVIEEAERLTFVPRHSRRERRNTGSAPLTYRTATVGAYQAEGVAPASDANLAGIHDAAALSHLWDADDDTLILVGNAPMRLPLVARPSAHLLMLPWLRGVETDPLQTPDDVSRAWRMPASDIWAALPVADTDPAPMIGLNTNMTGSRLVALAMGETQSPQGIIPVEQALFEPVDAQGAPLAIDAESFLAAPLFPRAMLALYAHLLQNDQAQLEPQSLVLSAPAETGTAPQLRRAVMSPALDVALDSDAAVDATLVVLSARELRALPLGRAIDRISARSATGDGRLSELRDLAEREMSDALIALRIVVDGSGQPSVATQTVPRKQDPLMQDGSALTRDTIDVVASPALGWPVAPTPIEPDAQSGGLGPEFVVQSPAAGFAGRTQRLYWPAVAHPSSATEDATVTAHYMAFGQKVLFDQGEAPFAHDGPATRHLLSDPARRRAPLDQLAADALRPDGSADTTEADSVAPLTAPVVDRTVIGVRPGVMTAMTAGSKTTSKAWGKPLDAGWPELGRLADGGPVTAHQLRAPRSPILPPDPSPDDLPQRRRTYVSEADVQKPVPAGEEPVLHQFRAWPGFADVIRIATADHGLWRLLVTPAVSDHRLRVAPDWNGQTDLIVEAAETGDTSITLVDLLSAGTPGGVVATLTIGQTTFPAAAGAVLIPDPAEPKTKARLPLVFVLSEALRRALETATAGTKMSLSVAFPRPLPGETPATGDINSAPLRELSLPVLLDPEGRRVVRTKTRTVVFGDPAYDRALGSPVLADSDRNDRGLVRFAADRREYNADSMMYFAIGQVSDETGRFVSSGASVALTFERLPRPTPGDPQTPLPEKLYVRTASGRLETPTISDASAVGMRLSDLEDAQGRAPLAPGDTLVITAPISILPNRPLVLRARIVAAPVIAPPASIYTLLETRSNDGGGPVARPRLHAAAALPTRIEFPALLEELGTGHVRRKALFVWPFTVPRRPGAPEDENLVLIKLDRSGGFQPPDF